MRFGIGTPVIAAVDPLPWEQGPGRPAVAAEIAGAADRLGYAHLTCSEHVAVPDGPYVNSSFWDPCATFGFLSAVTTSIRFVTYVLIIGLHHPLEIAKRYGTVDVLSNGRLTLGFGVGNEPLEFETLGASFDDRGERAVDALRALRVTLSRREPVYDGPFYRYADLKVDPYAVQDPVPLWLGGHTRRSLLRAIDLGDAWIPPPPGHRGPDPAKLASMLAAVDLPAGFDVGSSPGWALDPVGQPEACLDEVGRWEQAGATLMTVSFHADSAAQYLTQLEAFASIVGLDPAEP
jgi:probable F420-dependent oxidoreductase